MPSSFFRTVTVVLLVGVVLTTAPPAGFGQYPRNRKINIAHRGASAYAPEHTLAAYRLALEQGADYVEPDLQLTKDGVLVCLHDATLERTTNVRKVYPDRGRTETVGGQSRQVWRVADFTLEEIKRLDAGAWFGPQFAGERVPTFQEMIDVVRGKAGIYPEMKHPARYAALGFDMPKALLDVLKSNGLDRPGADPQTPVVIQSFDADSLRRLRRLGCRLPLVFLIDDEAPGDWISPDGMRRIRRFADGVGPSKHIVAKTPEVVRWARAAGLSVTLYTFKSNATGNFPDVEAEMRHFLYNLGVDAVFTNNPDRFPREERPE
ncbi:MAG: glycerophosphodiester phosphodiesterase [Chloracidobacterium sp.]|nr:glycerophosphodiester phosphodiesterase [Chloracidobacterium sp.]MDW8216570.1 glycerophosphodiester phosphodiesterase family protein [Acidobacteriota bacterium]